jgi:hypothetical protein
VSQTDRKRRLFDDLVRLRRVSCLIPGDEDVSVVRSRLEEELGETMSRRLAASVLGISHTALARWIRTGDVPIVFTPNGRLEVPVVAVLDLVEQIDPELVERGGHALEAAMKVARLRAERLDPRALVGGSPGVSAGHRPAELRSLAYHRALAQQLRRSMIDDARQKLWQWRRDGRIAGPYAEQWDQILRLPLPQIQNAISEDSEHAADLRQNSPFAGMLSEPERRKIVEVLS